MGRVLVPTSKACEECKGEFMAKHLDARFCGAKCRFKSWAKRNPRIKPDGVQVSVEAGDEVTVSQAAK